MDCTDAVNIRFRSSGGLCENKKCHRAFARHSTRHEAGWRADDDAEPRTRSNALFEAWAGGAGPLLDWI